MVVLSEPLPKFTGGNTHYGVHIGVVIDLPSEFVDAYGALLQVSRATLQGFLHQVAQETRVALARAEGSARQDPIRLFANGRRIRRGGGLVRSVRRSRGLHLLS